MGGILDRYRRFVVDGVPVSTGMVTVGDSWACTNPSLGRGITMGLMHALGTAEVVGQYLDDPLALALAQDSMTETRVTPWYRDTIEFDRTRIAQFNALIEGRHEPESSAEFTPLKVSSKGVSVTPMTRIQYIDIPTYVWDSRPHGSQTDT